MPVKPTLPARLDGPRVTLRNPTLRDAETIFATVDRNRRHLHPWMWWVDQTTSTRHIATFIRACQKGRRARTWFEHAIFHEGDYVGDIGLFNLNLAHRRGEIGYWLDKDATGLGLMTEATAVLTAAAYRHLGLDRIQICCQPRNTASRNIPIRLGFTHEGTLRRIVRMYGRPCDWDVFSMLRSEYREAKAIFSPYLARRPRG